ncbi:hypothetical protein EAF04_004710 [Stromatinia cepivora]|nr:hypothetical protein EAF04_004710 [Stromatinia cepivora]
MIIATDSLSPYHAELEKGIDHPLAPDLQAWSDITFLEWSEECASHKTPLTNLNHVIQCHITNEETIEVIEEILGERGTKLTPWGCKILMGDESGHGTALLGTPNGKGIGWILAQRRDSLQNPTLLGVEIFSTRYHDVEKYDKKTGQPLEEPRAVWGKNKNGKMGAGEEMLEPKPLWPLWYNLDFEIRCG